MVVSHHVGTGNQTQVFCGSNSCSKPLTHFSSLLYNILFYINKGVVKQAFNSGTWEVKARGPGVQVILDCIELEDILEYMKFCLKQTSKQIEIKPLHIESSSEMIHDWFEHCNIVSHSSKECGLERLCHFPVLSSKY